MCSCVCSCRRMKGIFIVRNMEFLVTFSLSLSSLSVLLSFFTIHNNIMNSQRLWFKAHITSLSVRLIISLQLQSSFRACARNLLFSFSLVILVIVNPACILLSMALSSSHRQSNVDTTYSVSHRMYSQTQTAETNHVISSLNNFLSCFDSYKYFSYQLRMHAKR